MSSSGSTLIRLDGRDALDLLHRISTQHLRELEPGRCRTTLFCDFRGRLRHRAAVARTADGTVWLVRADAPSAELIDAIDGQTFRDDVRLDDMSAGHVVTAVPAWPGVEAESLDEHEGLPMTLHLDGIVDWRIDPAAEIAALDEPGRIRLGWPRHAHEIRDAFNPFEVGLARDVHLDKGCFTGQEALLRMMTYGGVRRRLVLLEGDRTPPAVDDVLRQGNVDAGVVTSVAGEGTAWVALGVAKRDAIAADIPWTTSSGAAIARVTAFPDARPLGLPDSTATTA